LVVAALTGDDVILCQITSQNIADSYAVQLLQIDFDEGKLTRDSNIRPNRLLTADSRIVLYRAGVIKTEKMQEVVEKIFEIVTA
jgi:mRNA interferase MazF